MDSRHNHRREPPMLRMIVLAQDRVNFTPDFDAIPGAGPVQQLINGIGAFALLLSLVGIIIGGAMWGVGSLSSNYHQAAVGKRATLYSVVGAIIVGAAAALVNWAFSLGQTAWGHHGEPPDAAGPAGTPGLAGVG